MTLILMKLCAVTVMQSSLPVPVQVRVSVAKTQKVTVSVT